MITIKIPINKLSNYEKTQLLEELTSSYQGFEFCISEDDKVHFIGKLDNDENLFGIIVKLENGTSKAKAENKLHNIKDKYENEYPDCKFFVVPSYSQESEIINLTNSKKIVNFLF